MGKTIEERIAQIEFDDNRRIDQERQEETEILDKISGVTDPLAIEFMAALNTLPEQFRDDFVKGVLKRLVVQALHKADALDPRRLESFGFTTLTGYGTGRTILYTPDTSLKKSVIQESLPDEYQTNEFAWKD